MISFQKEEGKSQNIDAYLKELYCDPQATVPPPYFAPSTDSISLPELEQAFEKLSWNKSIGVDFLADNTLRLAKDNIDLKLKILDYFNVWYTGGDLPNYITVTRMFPLSKEDTAYPRYGQVRTIAISPAITKLYKHILLMKMEKHIESNNLLHKNQRGFR